MANEHDYGAGQIRVLKGLEPVRLRPGMYIGSTDERGLHHCVYEVIDNCVDEAMAGYCTKVDVILQKDGACTVIDNGRGIPVGIMKEEGVSAVEVVLTKLHAGGKFGGGGYEISGGLHGVGVSCVNALSSKMDVQVAQDGGLWEMSFARGIAQNHLTRISNTTRRGTTITFYPDPEIFETTEFDYATLRHRIQELAFLNKGLEFHLKDERDLKQQEETFKYAGGIVEYVELLNAPEKEKEAKRLDEMQKAGTDDKYECKIVPEDKPFYFTKTGTFSDHGTTKKFEVEIALQYNGGYSEKILTFANNINTVEGGQHLEGFKFSLLKMIRNYAYEMKYLKDNEEIKGDDTREGLVAVISVKLEGPQFEGQTKTKLGTPGIRQVVSKALEEEFGAYLEENVKARTLIVTKAILAKKGREAAEKVQETMRKEILNDFSGLPGKLADCTSKNAKECEIYLVEGDSAGGTAKTGRDNRFQAILPLRGKILNVQKATLARALSSEEIKNMITAFGCGIDQVDENGRVISKCDTSKLKYDKIISMTDADVDGSHIRILLITFIFKFMRPIIEEGHLYAAQPPLFKATKKGSKEEHYFYSDQELEDYLVSIDRKADIQRYKGLGEMDKEQLWETTMDPERRTLLRITVQDAEKAAETVEMLMGDDPEVRRIFIENNATLVKDLDV